MESVARDRIRRLKYFAFDSDGCLFPNIVWEGTQIDGVAFKPKLRSYYDGQGISLMRALGMHICVITNERDSNAAGVRATVQKWNDLPSCKNGLWKSVELFEGCGGRKKLETLTTWLDKHGATLNVCGAMGDDLVDVPMLRAVAFRAAPITAEAAIRSLCDFVSQRPGGEGAVRDLANYFVEAHDKDPLELPFD